MAPDPTSSVPRPPIASLATSNRRLRSSWVSAQNSPVQPPATTPVAPASIRPSILRAKPCSSMRPSSWKGVVMAGMGPDQVTLSRFIILSVFKRSGAPQWPSLTRSSATASTAARARVTIIVILASRRSPRASATSSTRGTSSNGWWGRDRPVTGWTSWPGRTSRTRPSTHWRTSSTTPTWPRSGSGRRWRTVPASSCSRRASRSGSPRRRRR